MFQHDYELMPRTYSIKGYKRRESLNFKKTFKYLLYTLIVTSVLFISILSAVHYI